jgi:hypothetical protein
VREGGTGSVLVAATRAACPWPRPARGQDAVKRSAIGDQAGSGQNSQGERKDMRGAVAAGLARLSRDRLVSLALRLLAAAALVTGGRDRHDPAWLVSPC